jgi:hypothetical protein
MPKHSRFRTRNLFASNSHTLFQQLVSKIDMDPRLTNGKPNAKQAAPDAIARGSEFLQETEDLAPGFSCFTSDLRLSTLSTLYSFDLSAGAL